MDDFNQTFDISECFFYDPEAYDMLPKEGTNLMSVAIATVNVPVVAMLLEHGADPETLDAAGKRPYDYCPDQACFENVDAWARGI